MSEITEAIQELVTVSYRLGAVGATGTEYFADGRTYTADELAERYNETSQGLERCLQEKGIEA